jgi:hypothetical protein
VGISRTFQQLVGSFGHHSWVVLFAQAPIDIVSDIYPKMMDGNVDRNILIDVTPRESLDEFAPTGAIVQVTKSDWTIIFHIVGHWSRFDTQDLSKRLNAKILEFSAEDTSGQVGCQLFAPDGEVKHFLTSNDYETMEEIYEGVSDYFEEMDDEIPPQPDSTIVESYEDLFLSLGIKTVQLCLSSERMVISTENEQSKITRVDLLNGVSEDKYFNDLEEYI